MKKEEDTLYDEALEWAIKNIHTLEPGSEEYKRQAESIQCLMTAKTEKENQKSRTVVPLIQTGVIALTNIVCLGCVIAFETKGHVFTMRECFQFLFKPKPC